MPNVNTPWPSTRTSPMGTPPPSPSIPSLYIESCHIPALKIGQPLLLSTIISTGWPVVLWRPFTRASRFPSDSLYRHSHQASRLPWLPPLLLHRYCTIESISVVAFPHSTAHHLHYPLPSISPTAQYCENTTFIHKNPLAYHHASSICLPPASSAFAPPNITFDESSFAGALWC